MLASVWLLLLLVLCLVGAFCSGAQDTVLSCLVVWYCLVLLCLFAGVACVGLLNRFLVVVAGLVMSVLGLRLRFGVVAVFVFWVCCL